jgi:DNA helicase HerA-like ATPase
MSNLKDDAIYLGKSVGADPQPQYLPLQWGNRHGLIAGATGTGKTVTLQVLAEGFAYAGVPVFMADVKGDLSGICMPSAKQDFLLKRAEQIGFSDEYQGQAFPVTFWDLYGEQGHPVRTTISEMGPLLLARILELNETQEGVLNIAFRVADEQGLLLMDMKDLRTFLTDMSEQRTEISAKYGNVTPQTIATIQRALLQLESQGGESFFGEPALDLRDFMRTDLDGFGMINILAADRLMLSPRLYATFLLWMLSELFEELPEAGDGDKPKLVFFFDEAHLLFNDAPKSLLEKVEQVVRLIRSKGVGIFFITQNPDDVPESILGQLGNRFQHALRSFTPRQQQAIKQAAETYRENPAFKVAEVITELEVGEALVSTLEGKGQPSIVQRTLIRPPSARLGPATEEARRTTRTGSLMGKKYDQVIDSESAYEVLQKRAEKATQQAQTAQKTAAEAKTKGSASRRQSPVEAAVMSAVRTVSTTVTRRITSEIVRGIMGAFKR